MGGELPGSAALRLSVVDADLEQQTLVEVVRPSKVVKAPKASKRTNSLAEVGYALELTSQTAGATIYYTLDGSCPCDENACKQYTGPIVLSEEENVEINAIAVREGMEDSDVATFRYTVTSGLHMPLTAGWNWVSYPIASMVRLGQLTATGNITRVLSQTQEAVQDPIFGWVGNLVGLVGGQGYKVQATATADVVLTEGVMPQSTSLTLQKGWNWIGYPCLFNASLTHALENAQAEEGDVIFGQGTFATYSGGQWTGGVDFNPGSGYMYKSASAKKLTFSAKKPVSARLENRQSATNTDQLPATWVADVTSHPDQMALIGVLYKDGQQMSARPVAAFCGDECRGVSRTDGHLVLLSVSGRPGELISLRTLDEEGHELHISLELPFEVDLKGTPVQPVPLLIDGVQLLSIDRLMQLAVEGVQFYDLGGRPVEGTLRKGKPYIMHGQKVMAR